METLNQDIEKHYFKKGLLENIIDRLKDMGVNLSSVSRSDIKYVDEFHVRGAAVSKELADSVDLTGLSVLDVGSGLGGPSRLLADEYGCQATGIDLSAEYVRTAQGLSKMVNLNDKTTYVQGDATDLPFGNQTFGAVWTQHVQMNIPDKQKFYSEIDRVLRVNGFFIYYDIFKKENIEVGYPMPWASESKHSFLFKVKEMENILHGLGMTKLQSTDQTQAGIKFFDDFIDSITKNGPPTLGLNVIMGASTKPKLVNLLAHLKNGALELRSGIYKKQSSK